jgi:hypothetical protein
VTPLLFLSVCLLATRVKRSYVSLKYSIGVWCGICSTDTSRMLDKKSLTRKEEGVERKKRKNHGSFSFFSLFHLSVLENTAELKLYF